jgi:uncharacterized membrane protein YedE/YeeE
VNAAAGAVGIVFGAALFLTGMADYDVIHDGLLFRSPHLYLMMLATLGTGVPLLAVLRRRGVRSVFGGPIAVTRDAIERKHVVGGVVFGTGWAIAGTCPGAVAAMAASGKPLALLVIAGVAIGVTLRDLQEERAATHPVAAAGAIAEPAAG